MWPGALAWGRSAAAHRQWGWYRLQSPSCRRRRSPSGKAAKGPTQQMRRWSMRAGDLGLRMPHLSRAVSPLNPGVRRRCLRPPTSSAALSRAGSGCACSGTHGQQETWVHRSAGTRPVFLGSSWATGAPTTCSSPLQLRGTPAGGRCPCPAAPPGSAPCEERIRGCSHPSARLTTSSSRCAQARPNSWKDKKGIHAEFSTTFAHGPR